jgi:hypothetical protein
MNKIDHQNNTIIEKNTIIEQLIEENNKLKKFTDNKSQINTIENNTVIDEDDNYVNYELANKMENLYLSLSQAQEELDKLRKNKVPKNRGFIDVFKSWFK